MTQLTKVLVLDAEILKGIIKKGEERIPGIEYCEGWRDFKGMGITVVGGWESDGGRFRTFDPMANSLPLQTAIDEAQYVVTFNGVSFDGPLLAEHGAFIPENKHVDLLRLIWQAHRLSSEFKAGSHAGFGLDACAKANGLPGKTGTGAFAPVMWQRGQYCDVIDYCIHDVWMTKELLLRALSGRLVSPKDPTKLIHLPLPPMTLLA